MGSGRLKVSPYVPPILFNSIRIGEALGAAIVKK
ncbi:MAG: hypothetical protein ACJA16_001469 [Akkermansiaceae bacterium]|jgi:hypothetical protein